MALDVISYSKANKAYKLARTLKSVGRFVSGWNAVTGLPTTTPPGGTPYAYQTGDYYRVLTVGSGTNYKPDGSSYTGAASTVVETDDVQSQDLYIYDGSVWQLYSLGTLLDKYVPTFAHTFTTSEKLQARTNIGAQEQIVIQFLGEND